MVTTNSECQKQINIIRTAPKKEGHTVFPTNVIRSDRLSLDAIGLWLIILSKPDDWKFSVEELIERTSLSRKKIMKVVKELEEVGLLIRERLWNNGRFSGLQYIIYDQFPEKR
jgi:DNA-binding MarR family transcriptional regulator